MLSSLARLLQGVIAFEWDEGNCEKNWQSHGVTWGECEQVFFHEPIIFFDDDVHSQAEKRYGLYGESNKGRGMTVFFTIRNGFLRIISARDQSKKERSSYQMRKKLYFENQNKI